MAPSLQPHQGRSTSPDPGPRSREHKHRRRFIGPMPESALTSEAPVNRKTQKKRRWFSSSYGASVTSLEDEDQGLHDVIKAHAYEFFKCHGGKDEDWGEDRERSVREEMLKRWRQSEWGRLRAAKESGTKNRWVGASFDIGTFLGVNVLDKPHLTTSPTSSPPGSPTRATFTGKQSSARETYVTAPSNLSTPSRKNDLVSGTLSDLQNQSSYFTLASTSEEQPGTAPEEPLAGPSHVMDRLGVPELVSANGLADRSATPSQSKGKKKQVHYEDETYVDEPTSPSNVLARSGQEVAKTSAGAVEAVRLDTAPGEGGVLMRGLLRSHDTRPISNTSLDRMLVRVSHTGAGTVGTAFDENQNRVTQHLEYEDWSEFMVVWRKERLELYEDYASRRHSFVTISRLLTDLLFIRVSPARSGSRSTNTLRLLSLWTVPQRSSLSIRL